MRDRAFASWIGRPWLFARGLSSVVMVAAANAMTVAVDREGGF